MKTAGPPYRSLNPMASERVLAKRAALRLRIIEEALAAFAARGFEATTMTDIADRLQMTGPALYHYFATKDALLFACLDQMLDHLLAEVARAAAGDDAPAHRLARVVRAQVALEIRQGSAASLVNAHLYGPRYLTEALPAPQRETLRIKQRELVQVYRSLIDEGIAAGQFMPTATAIAAFNVLAIVQYSGVWYRPRKGRRAADVIEAQSAAVLSLLSVPAPGAMATPHQRPTPARTSRSGK